MLEYFVPNVSTYGGDIDNLFTLITIIVGVWFVLGEIVLFYLVFRFRRKPGVKAQYITGEKKSETKWTHRPHMIFLLCDLVLVVATIMVWMNVKQTLPTADYKVRVISQQWAWTFVHPGPDGKLDTEDDVTTIDHLHVKKDKVYHFLLESKDVLHSFSVPVFRLKQDAVPGRVITGWFEATQTGTFDIQCAEICGIGHGLMAAKITIADEAEHQMWLASLNPTQAVQTKNLALNGGE